MEEQVYCAGFCVLNEALVAKQHHLRTGTTPVYSPLVLEAKGQDGRRGRVSSVWSQHLLLIPSFHGPSSPLCVSSLRFSCKDT